MQTLTLIGEMRLEWPKLAKQIMAVLSLQTLRIPGANPECVMDEETSVNMSASSPCLSHVPLAYCADQRATITLTACRMPIMLTACRMPPRSLLLHGRPTFWIFAYTETGLILLTLASAYRIAFMTSLVSHVTDTSESLSTSPSRQFLRLPHRGQPPPRRR